MEKLKLKVNIVSGNGTVMMNGEFARLSLTQQNADLFERGDEYELTLKKLSKPKAKKK